MFDHETPKIPPIEVQCKAPGLKVDLQASSARCGCDGSRIRAFADVDLQHFSCPVTGPWKMLEKSIFHGKIHGFRLRFSLKPIQWKKPPIRVWDPVQIFCCQKKYVVFVYPMNVFWGCELWGMVMQKTRRLPCNIAINSDLHGSTTSPPKSSGRTWKWWSQARS